eukprot:500108-Rhodomonas_salina.1
MACGFAPASGACPSQRARGYTGKFPIDSIVTASGTLNPAGRNSYQSCQVGTRSGNRLRKDRDPGRDTP